MINILLSGCNGRMGKVITNLVKTSYAENLSIVAGYDKFGIVEASYPVYTELDECKEKADVIVDFSNPDALEAILKFAKGKGMPIIISTTGHSEEQRQMMREYAKDIPVFNAGNMSLGVNLLVDLVMKAAKVLEDRYDIEIIEKHHNQKLDAPSGTALMIADAINTALSEKQQYVYDRHEKREKRSKKEIGIHAVRGGNIVGEHSVIFAGTDEVIEINHYARSREIFAHGALKAAMFMAGQKPGFYNMKNVLG